MFINYKVTQWSLAQWVYTLDTSLSYGSSAFYSFEHIKFTRTESVHTYILSRLNNVSYDHIFRHLRVYN